MADLTSDNQPTNGADFAQGMTNPMHEHAAVPEDGSEVMTASAQPKKSKVGRALLVLILLAAVAAGIYFLFFQNKTSAIDVAKIQGKVALSEQDLRAVVAANHLTVYWAGPMAGAKYSLTAINPNLISLKYLPGGVGINDATTPFRTVGTYVQKNAYQVGKYTGTVAGNIGMMTPDGNSLFYAFARQTNVYIGIKGKDIQVEVFDPVAGTALGLALKQNQIVPIS